MSTLPTPSTRAHKLVRDYALGTLHGPARRRFERLLAGDPVLAREVACWQARLSTLAWLKPARRPSALLGYRLRARARGLLHGLWRSLALWRGLALAASVTAVAALAWIAQRPVPAPAYVAVLASEAGSAAWLVKADTARLRIRVLKPPQALPGDYELWLLPGGQAAPLSLGLLSASPGGGEFELSPAVARSLGRGEALAVSREPKGGSPTGLPTGPVSHTSRLYRL